MSNSNFSIIALRLLPGNPPHIKKVLKDGWYLFNQSYEVKKDASGNEVLVENSKYPLKNSPDFFGEKDNINVSAIVGKNGSGKSALIDFVLRLINNAFHKIYSLGKENFSALYTSSVDVAFVKGVRAELFFVANNQVFVIRQEDDNETPIYPYCYGEPEAHGTREMQVDFYTISMNYSLYGFNSLEYEKEWEEIKTKNKETGEEKTEYICWLEKLFNKNDGYQTPIVLNPYRDKGNIDINREHSLARQRLVSLFFKDTNEKNTAFTNINEFYAVHSLKITLDSSAVEKKYKDVRQLLRDTIYKHKGKALNDKIKKIKTGWENSIINAKKELDKKHINTPKINSKCYKLAIKYLIYKTLSIAYKHEGIFKPLCLAMPYKLKLGTNRTVPPHPLDSVEKFIDRLSKDTSHITYKIRQTITFLTFGHTLPDLITDEKFDSSTSYDVEIGDFADSIKKWNEFFRYIDFVPCPIFKTEIMLKEIKSQNTATSPFDGLSSGEHQLIYLASSILYHIRNISSVSKINTSFAKREYVNIILDEIELYFHPEYQRRFLDYLTTCIKEMQFADIKGVNIIAATHSPFILSDIPKCNVMFLKEGQQCNEMQEDTFGANIHSLLQNAFFLGSSIGDFAKKKINELFRVLHGNETDKINEQLYEEILMVGEPFLRSQLLKLYNERNPKTQNEIEILKKRIEELEKTAGSRQ